VPQDEKAAVRHPHLEITVRRIEPTIEQLDDFEPALAEAKSERLLIAAVACVALDADLHGAIIVRAGIGRVTLGFPGRQSSLHFMRSIFDAHLVNQPFGDPGVYVDFRFERRAFLFDLGDNAPLPPRKLLRVSHVFVSHTHMDHFIGFDRLIRICLGRHASFEMFGPPGFIDRVEHRLAAYTWDRVDSYDVSLTITATEIDAGGDTRSARFETRRGFAREMLGDGHAQDGVIVDGEAFRVRCVLLDHRTPCLGYAVEEKTHVNVWKNRLVEMGYKTGPWLADLKRTALAGEGDDTPIRVWWREAVSTHEEMVPLGALKPALEFVPGQKLCYVTDVVFHEANFRRIVELARGADMFFIESVFLDSDAAHGAQKQHLTARQAGTIARAAGAKSVIPFHFSPRYADREAMLRAEIEVAHGAEARTPS
jgi:ribonuclease Z